jgi:hypothetical protein
MILRLGNTAGTQPVGMVGVARSQPAVDLADLALQVVYQRDRRRDVRAPRLRDVEPRKEPPARGRPKIDQRRAVRCLSTERCLTR